MEPEDRESQAARPVGMQELQVLPEAKVVKENHVLRVVPAYDAKRDNLPASELYPGIEIMARWYFAPEEWEHFIRAERARVIRMLRTRYLLISVPVLLFIIFAGAASIGPAGLAFAIFAMLLLAVPACLYIGGSLLWDYRTKVLWCDKLRTIPKEVLITRSEVVFGGLEGYKTSMNRTIKAFASGLRARVQLGDEHFVCFEVTHYLLHSYREQIRVPIPAGFEDEAVALVQRFRRHDGGTVD